jgi:hypothetical protein
MTLFSYWFGLGIIYLIILTYQDFKKKEISEKFNFFMMGASLMLVEESTYGVLYLLTISLISGFIPSILTYFKAFNPNEGTGIMWLFMGFGFASYIALGTFLAIFTIAKLLSLILSRIAIHALKGQYKPLPSYHIILLAYIITYIVI